MGVSSTDIANFQATAGLYRTLAATITRSGVLQSGTYTCRVRPAAATYQPVPGSVLLRVPTWDVILPPLTDVREEDVISVTWPGPIVRTYGVTALLDPRSFEIERIAQCYLASDGALGAGASGVYLPVNATVSVARASGGVPTTIYSSRAVYLEYPTRQEQVMASGAEVPVLLCDLPDATYQNGDVVTILGVSGHTVTPHPAALRAGLVERLSGPPPLTSVQLTGLGGYS